MQNSLDLIDLVQLDGVQGGVPNGFPAPTPRPEPKKWVDGLSQNLRDRGYNPQIDPGMRIPTPNQDTDKGIERQWDPFSTPSGEAGT